MLRLLLVLPLFLCFAGCDSGSSGDPDAPDVIGDLAGTEWVLQSFGGSPDVPEATLRFNRDLEETTLSTDSAMLVEWAGSIEGRGSCNTFRGEYRYTEGGFVGGVQLSLTVQTSTEAACGEDAAFETAYFNAINQAIGWSRNDDRLRITAPDGTVAMQFERD